MGICVQEISDKGGPYSYSAVVVMRKMLIQYSSCHTRKNFPIPVTWQCVKLGLKSRLPRWQLT